jgi:competence protein ComEA
MDFQLTKEQQLIVIGLVASIVVGLAVMALRPLFNNSAPQPMIIQPRSGQAPRTATLVQVCGAVRREGVYKLRPGDRVFEAIALAGGAQPLADLSAVDLAETVKDGEKILVPCKQPLVREAVVAADGASGSIPSGPARSGKKAASLGAKVNINTADEKTLDSLPGVGPSTAKAIIEYRRTKGSFAKPEQIMEIPRFGKSKFEKIKDMITI